MENISKLLSTEHYAFNDGDVLYADAMQGIREKINELVEAFNTLFGNGNSGSGSQNAPYIYMAAQMTVAGEDSPVRDYEGEVYSPTSETKLVVETLLGAVGVNDDFNEWYVYDMYNSLHNIANAAGIIRFKTADTSHTSQSLPSIQTWFGNTDMYNSQPNPGSYLGHDYIFDCRTEVYDTNYGILCYMSDYNGWVTYGDNINGIVPTKVPTKFQIYNDPDVYGGTFIDKENYLFPDLKNVTNSGTEKPIITSTWISGSYPDDISINNAILMRSIFKYGGSNCVIDKNSKWTIPYFYIYPRKNEEGAYIDELNVNMGLDNYYKLKLSDEENTEWETTGIDTFARVQNKAVVAQHDFLLGLIIGVIREKDPAANNGEGETWAKLQHVNSSNPGTDDAIEVINDCLLNDYDPRMRYIWQIRNKASFQSVLLQCMRDLSLGTSPDSYITVYLKQDSAHPGKFERVKAKDAVIDCIAEHLLEFLGPEMPWESRFSDPNDPDWGVSVSLDNNMLSTGFEIYNGTYAGQGYDAYLDWWDKKLQEDFNGDRESIHDKIIFNGNNWVNVDTRNSIKQKVQGSDATKSAIRSSAKDALKAIISRDLGGDDNTSGYDTINYDHALRAHYKESNITEWNNVVSEAQKPDTEWTIEKYRRFVYYKVDNEHYQYIYSCADTVNDEDKIRFFIFKDPQTAHDAHEGVYINGYMSADWVNSIKNWYSNRSNIQFLDPNDHSRWYLKRFHSWDCDYDGTFDDWEVVKVNGEEVFRVQLFTDTYGQTRSNNVMVTNSYTYCIDNTYSNSGDPDLNAELHDACTKHWVDIFGQGPVASGGVSFSTKNVTYGYIIRGTDVNGNSGDDKVSIGKLYLQNYLTYITGIDVTAAAYSWALLLARSGLHFSTKPLIDEIGVYLNMNLKLLQLSLQFYEEYPNESLESIWEKTQIFGWVSDVYFGSNDKYISNTVKASMPDDTVRTRLSKSYVTQDWSSWLDLKNLYFSEGPCVENEGKTTIRENDILVVLRNVKSINNHIIGDMWIDDNGVFGSSNHTTLSWGTDTLSGPGGDLSLDVIGANKINLTIDIPNLEEITIPNGMPGGDPTDPNKKYGRFGGQFQLGAVKADSEHKISRLALNTLYPYGYNQDSIYGTAKINVKGYQIDRIDNLPGLY